MVMMTKQLDLFNSINTEETFKFNIQKYCTFKSAIEASKFRYRWFVNTLDVQKGLCALTGYLNVDNQELQSLLDQHKVIVNKINQTYQIWADNSLFKNNY
jgi:hypothetical protein